MKRIRTPSLVVALIFTTVTAQAAAQSRPGLSADITGGVSTEVGGNHRPRNGIALDLLVSGRIQRRASRAVVVGATAGLKGPLGDDAGFSYPALADGPRIFPRLYLGGIVGGVELSHRTGAAFRLLGGPIVASGAAGTGGGHGFGIQGRADAASPSVSHFSLMAAIQALTLPRFQGATHTIAALSLGVQVR